MVVLIEKFFIGWFGICLEYFIEKEVEVNKKLSELMYCIFIKNFKFDIGWIGILVF